MPLSDFDLRASIAVSDIERSIEFYEGKLGLRAVESGPSAEIPDASRVYESGGGPALNVYQSGTARQSSAADGSRGSETRTATPSRSRRMSESPGPEREPSRATPS